MYGGTPTHLTQRQSPGRREQVPNWNARRRPGRGSWTRRPISSPPKGSTQCRWTPWPKRRAEPRERCTPTSGANRGCSWLCWTGGKDSVRTVLLAEVAVSESPEGQLAAVCAAWPAPPMSNPVAGRSSSTSCGCGPHVTPEVADVIQDQEHGGPPFQCPAARGVVLRGRGPPHGRAGGVGRAGHSSARRTGHAAPPRTGHGQRRPGGEGPRRPGRPGGPEGERFPHP